MKREKIGPNRKKILFSTLKLPIEKLFSCLPNTGKRQANEISKEKPSVPFLKQEPKYFSNKIILCAKRFTEIALALVLGKSEVE